MAVLIGVYSNLPWIIAGYYALTTMLGATLLRVVPPPDLRERLGALFQQSLRSAEFWHDVVRLLRPLLWPYMLGSLIGATILAAIAYRAALEFVVRRRRHHSVLRPDQTD